MRTSLGTSEETMTKMDVSKSSLQKTDFPTVKTATSYTDRTNLLPTLAFMSTNPLDPSRKRPRRVHVRRRSCKVPPAHVNYVRRRASQRIQRDVLIPTPIRGSCNVNKGVTNGILDTFTTWHKIL